MSRERFFFEGMRLEIGPCFRDYSPPGFFGEATQSFKDRAKLLDNGGLEDYVAGLPFSHQSIARDDPDAGLKWLWNVEHRYQAAGFRGRFRMTDLLGRVGRAEPFEGEMFKILLMHRSDLPEAGYALHHAALYLSLAPKSDSVKRAIGAAHEAVEQTPAATVPPTGLAKALDSGVFALPGPLPRSIPPETGVQ